MNHNYNCDERQRFSLRKLTVGLASVLVGLTLFGYSQTTSQTVHAATTGQADPNANYDESGSAISIPGGPTLDPNGNPVDQTVDVDYGANDQTQTIHYHTSDGQPAKDKDGQPVPDGHVTGNTDDMNKDIPMPNGYVPKTPGTDDKTDLNNPDPNTGKVPDKTVTVEHGQHTTAPGETHNVGDQITPNPKDPKDAKVPGNTYQQAITDQDVKKDLTRTVTINKPKADGNTTIGEGGKQQIDLDPETETSTVSYHRTTTVDDVTGLVTGHGDWTLVDPSKNQFDGVAVPQVDGYTATITDGEGHTLSSIDPETAPTTNDAIEGYQSPKIVINYKANDQSVNYVFTDGAKGNVISGTVHGVTGQTVDSKTALATVIKQLTDKGYDMSKVTIDSYKFSAHNGDITIDLANDHGIIKGVDPNPGGQDHDVPGDATKIPEGLTDPYDGHVVTLQDTRHEIIRSITVNQPTGDDENSRMTVDVSQRGVVTRTFDYDPVTKTITKWNEWRPVSWDAVPVIDYPGYTATITDDYDGTLTSIDAMTTSEPSYHHMIEVNYTANSQSRNYVFKDGEKTVGQKAVSGVTDQTVDPATQLGDIKSDLKSKGYDLSKIDLGGSYKFEASGNDPKVIDLSQAHGSKEVGADDKIPDGITDPNKSGSDKHVTDSDVTETVTRHITFHDPTHENSTSTQDRNADQTVTLKRGFTYDTVTNEVTKYGDWTTQAVPAVDVPTVAGYTATVSGADLQDGKIPSDTLRDGYKDPKIEVTYTAQDSTQTIHYVDKEGHDLTSDDNKDNHGQVIGDSTVTVKTDEVDNVQVPKGWKLVDPSDANTKVAYGDDGHIPTKVVKIEHDTVTVDPSENVTLGDPIDPQNPDGPKYPVEARHDNLYKIAQRRVVFKLPSSTKASDYAKRLKDTGLTIDDTDIDEAANTVTVIEKIAEKRSVIIDAVTGKFKGYVDDNDKDANKAQGWVIDQSDTANFRNTVPNGQFANFKEVLIPQISGYKAKVNVGKTTVTLTPHSRMLLTPMMVSFMAFAPNLGFNGISGDSNGKVVNHDAKPDGKGDVGIKDVKDLSQKDKDQIMPGQKGDDHKGQDQGKGQPAKGDDHKGQDQGEGQPAKGDDHKNQDQGTNKDDLKGDNTQGQTTQNGGQDTKGDQTPQDANGNQGAAGSTETAKGKGSVDKTNEKPSKKTNKKSSKSGKKIANGNSKVSGHKTDKKSAKKAVKNNTTETTKASVQNAVQSTKAAAPVANAKAEQNGNGTVQAATVNSGAKEGTLPQTGENQNNKLGIIGLALASIAGLFSLAGDKKRKRN